MAKSTFQITISALKIPKVGSSLLQITPAYKWNFSLTFFEKFKNKNKGTLQEREQTKKQDVKKIQNSLGKVPAQSWVNLY